MATKLYSPFFSARRRASAIIRLVGTFDLGSSNSRYVSGTQRNAKHRGVVVRQSGRPASHAYGAFHYIKPFQCIIYFCVSHLRYGLCTGDGGQRALCNIDLKIAAWQRLDSERARARPSIHYPHVRFFTEVLLPSHLYCDKPILHSAGHRRSPNARDVARAFSRTEERHSMCRAKGPPPLKTGRCDPVRWYPQLLRG